MQGSEEMHCLISYLNFSTVLWVVERYSNFKYTFANMLIQTLHILLRQSINARGSTLKAASIIEQQEEE
jgi:hypothetical protein